MEDSLARIRAEVIACRRCPRLVDYRERIARERKREFREEEYWARPVPGFGDPQARLVAVGLAPAAHGSNRTGRVFTGDRSAGFLVRAFHAAGFANQSTSLRRGDGLRYTDLYVTAAVRCAPPGNHPRPDETARCRPFLERELRSLTNARAILALGGFAWDAVREAAPRVYGGDRSSTAFAHGACAVLGAGGPLLWGSYHPSPQNTNTGKLTMPMLVGLLERIRASLDARPRHRAPAGASV
ncbi:MAG TPA: uracil-DNA glycosylase [Thermoplasmata archaeon]|nr:uracil-DNA glycosylase [Thermoplasmata archaeon]